jgi:polyribonucleotide nucleotidyltransferase
MGSVCASSMALMAAGVPVSHTVAGVAMGLIKEGDDHIVLTDIAGVEDHLGDMDFKVAGTAEGITALQMDIKISGVTFDILRDALEQARRGRLFILEKMSDVIEAPREQLSPHAPRIELIRIDPDKIGAVIGKGGETIRALQEEFDAEIDIEDDGTVRVYASTGALVEACIRRIEAMTKEAEVGDRFTGKVVKTTPFGAFVELTKGTDGLLHISNIKPGERVGAVEDVLKPGDELDVTVVEVDPERGRIGLRLSGDPAIEGKTAAELSALGTGDPTMGRGGGRGGRDGRQRERLDGERRGGRGRERERGGGRRGR